ncbi:uncharacterized protein [Drosophila tropicalis]|uniref:uncharacterized protein n=1 Tax=Drosophila tropicalis TaxID=46794 RepID=UPI0035ABAF1C
MKRYKQKLRDVWLQMPEFRPWLRRNPEDSYRAHCRLCKCGVNTKICDLRAHALTKKHMKWFSNNSTSAQTVSQEHKLAEMTDVEYLEDDQIAYEMPASKSKPRPKIMKPVSVKRDTKSLQVKREKRESSNPIDYEEIIENIALYETEQVEYSNQNSIKSDHDMEHHQVDEHNFDDSQFDEETTEIETVQMAEVNDLISKAVTAAVKNHKDSSQVFGDFVADRLRQLTNETSEFTKDKIMQVLLEASALDRGANCS